MCINSSLLHNYTAASALFGRWPGSHYLSVVVAILSMLGSLFIIVSFCMSQDLRRATSRQIVVFISVADFVSCCSNCVGALYRFRNWDHCSVQAIFTTVGTLSFLMWTTCLAIYLYCSLVLDRVETAKRLMPLFHGLGWLFPLIVGIVAYCCQALGSSLSLATDGWCWVSIVPRYPEHWECKDAYVLWMLVTMKGWEVTSYVLVPALYIRIKIHLYQAKKDSLESAPLSKGFKQALASVDKKLIIVPVAYVLLRVWGTIRTFNFIFHRYGNSVPKSSALLGLLNYMQALGDNGQGLVNFILFVVLTRKVRNNVSGFIGQRLCRRVVSCCSSCSRLKGDNRDDSNEEEDWMVHSDGDSEHNSQNANQSTRRYEDPYGIGSKTFSATSGASTGNTGSLSLGRSRGVVGYGSISC